MAPAGSQSRVEKACKKDKYSRRGCHDISRILPYVSVAQTYLKLMGGFAKQLGIASETGEIMNETDE